MQGIGYFFGGKVIQAKVPMHGKTSTIKHTGSGIFSNLPQDIEIMRYHSLIVEKESIPKILEITAETPEGEIMGLRHKNFPIEGIQFHPESFATEGGKQILKNFLLQKAVILHS
jgi:anthranilate synthase/aminodeoxychorismate synthase-like glutamine amidotransferase